MVALFCITFMLLCLLSCLLAFRALKQREDLKNDAAYFRVRLLLHTIVLFCWCLGIKFLFLITSDLLSLLLPTHPAWVEGLTWTALVTYPVIVLVAYLCLWRGLTQGQSYEQVAPYLRLPARGLFPIVLLWAAVFFIWNMVH